MNGPGEAFDEDEDEDDSLHTKYLNFGIAGEDYAINVSCVTEIVRLQKIFSVPDVQSHIRGVINLRGKVIPLLDVRARFGLPEARFDDRTVVVVIESGNSPVGLVVDGVYGIFELPPEQIEPAPPAMRTGTAPLVSGLGKRDAKVSFIIDVSTLVSTTADGLSPEAPRSLAATG